MVFENAAGADFRSYGLAICGICEICGKKSNYVS